MVWFLGSVVSERREDAEGEETRDWLRNEEPHTSSLYALQVDRCSGMKNNYRKRIQIDLFLHACYPIGYRELSEPRQCFFPIIVHEES